MRVLAGMILAFLALSLGTIALNLLGFQVFPPPVVQLLPFVLAGVVYGRYARRRPLAAAVAGLPLVVLVLGLDALVDAGVSLTSLAWAGAALLLSWGAARPFTARKAAPVITAGPATDLPA